MPNFYSNGDDYYPCSDDPVLYSQQLGSIKQLKNGFSISTLKTALDAIDPKTSGKFQNYKSYKRGKETGA